MTPRRFLEPSAEADVSRPVPLVRHLLLGLLGVALAATALAQSVPARRFSQALSAKARVSAGLPRLDSDETAVLDALIRRDAADSEAKRATAATFTQRLSADEYRHAGLGHLTTAELVNLDAFVAAREATTPAAPLWTAPRSRASAGPVDYDVAPPTPHGEMFLAVGGGRGFSERAGGVALTLEDAAPRLAISFGYTERRIDWH